MHGCIHPLPIRLHGVVLNLLSTGTTLPFAQKECDIWYFKNVFIVIPLPVLDKSSFVRKNRKHISVHIVYTN
jgi:hypothetical protein